MKKTALYSSHKAQGARFISFAGWTMPFFYKGLTLEHLQVRKSGGLFDVSHMGQIRITGKDSLIFLEKLLPSNINSLYTGKALYSVLCSHKGGMIDDLIVYSCSQGTDYLLCVNAATKDKDLEWIKSQKNQEKVSIEDESDDWALIAVQGPKSLELCEKVFPSLSLSSVPRFHFLKEQNRCLFSRTGYTGEDGFEIYIPWEKSKKLWDQLVDEGQKASISPVGFGARDTLRLEMGYLLSGQDFNESKSPLQCGLSWLLTNKKNYIGKTALLKQKKEGGYSKIKGFILKEPSGVPRTGTPVYSDEGVCVGAVTSGAKSPCLEKMIGLAYIQGKNNSYELNIRGSKVKAEMIQTPFFTSKHKNT